MNKRLVTGLGLFAVLQLAIFGCGGSGGGSGGTAAESTSGMPRLVSAAAPSMHYVDVRFAEALPAEGIDPGRYQITAPNGSSLPVSEAFLGDSPTQVILTTEAQQPVLYTLTVLDPASTTAAPAAATRYAAGQTISFAGAAAATQGSEPILETAVALNNTQVLLTFDQPVLRNATQINVYRIVALDGSPPQDVGDLAIVSATLSADGINVTLATSPQLDLEYRVIVTNVAGKNGDKLIDPTKNTATFIGILPVDTAAPRVTQAVATSGTTVLVSFSEPLRGNPLDNPAEDASNYTLTPSVVILSAEMNDSHTQVLLSTLPLVKDLSYTVTVQDVTDLSGNVIDPAHNSASFTFTGV